MTRKRLERQLDALFSDSEVFTPESETTPKEPPPWESLSERPKVRPSEEEPPVAEEGSVESAQSNSGSSNGQRDLVAFRLDRQTYALPIEPLVQIIEMVTITPVPQLDSSVEGVINMRGVAVPVVDLRRHLGLPQAPLQLRTPIVLVQVGQWTVGLIVDEVLDVLKLSNGRVARTADILPEGLGEAPGLQGLAHTADGTVLLLAPEHLFRPSHKQALTQAVETLPKAAEKQSLSVWAAEETSPAETARGNKA